MSVWDAVLFGAMVSAMGAAWLARRARIRQMRELEEVLEAADRGDWSRCFEETDASRLCHRLLRMLRRERIRAQELGASRDALNALISDIAHQTKTPVANLQVYAELLEESAQDDRARTCAAAISQQARHLGDLAEALAKTSRLEGGIIALDVGAHDVDGLVRSVASEYALRAAQAGHEIACDIVPARAYFDPRWTSEALSNLVDNAIKYGAPGRPIRMKIGVYGTFVEVSVENEGDPIDEAEHAQVFRRFYRGARAQGSDGVGLGLYLARAIASRQGGSIRLKSRDTTVFSLLLPTLPAKGPEKDGPRPL